MAKGWTNTLDIGPIAAKVAGLAADALYEAGEIILAESDTRVPIEEGTLSRSGHVSENRDQLQVAVSYDTPYAVVQHEEMSFQHDAGREAKYLENAFRHMLPTVRNHVAARIRGGLNG
jgi:hypothetical protein